MASGASLYPLMRKPKSIYAIDVDPDTGKIIWTISTTEMPGGEFTLSISVNVKH